jgi:hypothetical protein
MLDPHECSKEREAGSCQLISLQHSIPSILSQAHTTTARSPLTSCIKLYHGLQRHAVCTCPNAGFPPTSAVADPKASVQIMMIANITRGPEGRTQLLCTLERTGSTPHRYLSKIY